MFANRRDCIAEREAALWGRVVAVLHKDDDLVAMVEASTVIVAAATTEGIVHSYQAGLDSLR